ncbi:hypothetical protein VP01_14817g1, partial [Puccinia sorghi]
MADCNENPVWKLQVYCNAFRALQCSFILYAKLSKCEFHNSSLQFLGVIVSSDGISMDPDKCQKVLDWPQPSSVKTLQASKEFKALNKAFTTAPILAHF